MQRIVSDSRDECDRSAGDRRKPLDDGDGGILGTDPRGTASAASLRRHRSGPADPGSPAYENAALIIGGRQPQAFLQRIPVPVGMWRPFGVGPSVPLRLGRPGTIEIAGQRVAFLICYEQLLVLPILLSAIDRPTLIVGMANQYWVRETSIPAAQRASLMAWSRLFALPLLIAENK